MVITKIVHGDNVAIKEPEKQVPCSVEDCPDHGKLGYYQVIGYTNFGHRAMRLVLFLCRKHQKEFDDEI